MKNYYYNYFVLIIFSIWLKVHATHIPNDNLDVVNGEVVDPPHSLPYVVSLQTTINDRFIQCGGSLIRNDVVLTAAWCVKGATEIEVILGAQDISIVEDTQIRLNSTNFTAHAHYDTETHENDIAVVYLPEKVNLTEAIGIIATPSENNYNESYTDELGTIAGWGKYNDTSPDYSDVLRKIDATILSYFSCSILTLFNIHFTQICTTGVQNRANICLGDSGSPLVVQKKTEQLQVGIASYGSDWACGSGSPGIHTRLTYYIDWIEAALK